MARPLAEATTEHYYQLPGNATEWGQHLLVISRFIIKLVHLVVPADTAHSRPGQHRVVVESAAGHRFVAGAVQGCSCWQIHRQLLTVRGLVRAHEQRLLLHIVFEDVVIVVVLAATAATSATHIANGIVM